MGVYDAYGRSISNWGDWRALAEGLTAGGYEEEFVICDSLSAEDAAGAAAAGFMPMSAQLVTPDGPHPFLTPKLHLMRCLADPASIRPTRTALGRSARYSVALKLDFGAALAGCVRTHGEAWLTEPLARAFKALAAEPPRAGLPTFISVELYAERGPAERSLVAAEIGYALGSSYASLSGFSDESGAGTVQLYALAGLLAELGVSVWDLGMPLSYKLALGAREYPRDAYLPALIRAYGQAMPPAIAAAMPLRPAKPLLAALRRRPRAGSS